MKVKEYRKYISEGIKDGKIEVAGVKPRALSKYIAQLNKTQCEEIVSTGIMHIDDNSIMFQNANNKSYGKSDSGNSGSGSGSGNSGSGSGAQPLDKALDAINADAKKIADKNYQANDADNCDSCCGTGEQKCDDEGHEDETIPCDICDGTGKSDSDGADNSGSDADYNLISDKGIKTLEDVKADLNIGDVDISAITNDVSVLADNVANFLGASQTKIDEAIASINDVQKVEIVLDGDVITDPQKHYHPKFEQIVKYAKLDKNVMLVGEAGTGKTTTAEQVAEALNLDFAYISCTMGMSESHLLGRPTINGGYISTRFVEVFENGGVFLFDEFDALDSNMFCVINSALANGKLSVPYRTDKPEAIRHKDCIIIACGNTWGTGQGSRMYNGRNAIDGATLDRFTNVSFGYDNQLERKLIGEHEQAYNVLIELRNRVQDKNLQRIVSTRAFVKANKHLSNGISLKEFINTLTESWTSREIDKVNIDEILDDFLVAGAND